MTADLLTEVLPQGVEGFHCHCHCESSSYELERTLKHLEEKFIPLVSANQMAESGRWSSDDT